MRIYAHLSYLFSVLAALIALVLHLRAATGVWAGVPYRADVLVYPSLWVDRWSVGAATVSITCLLYAFLFSSIAKREEVEGDAIRRLARVLNAE